MRTSFALTVITFAALGTIACTERVVTHAVGSADPSTPSDDSDPAGEDPSSEPEESAVDAGAPGTKPKDGGTDASKPGKDAGKPAPGKSDGGAPAPPADAGSAAPDAGASFTGIGMTVAECNGDGAVSLYGPGTPTATYDVKTVWVYGSDPVTGTGNKIFGYTRPQVSKSTLPLTGTPGEKQVRLSIASSSPTLTVGAQYQGAIALSEWDATNGKWATIAGSTTTALVFIDSFGADQAAWNDGHMCAGKISGHVESIADGTGATRLDFYFVAPLLTPSFPK